eukprot:TRINITY_DN13565_c0_g3_i1.p1 TRINITY_DN13565_c0_g3~~TRINITY_DN13565_c0_g3_i1.p1  ORF type:complete len:131 (-),score=36.43 TRINITY_DN13565_c0_g3_i1:392-784(-)
MTLQQADLLLSPSQKSLLLKESEITRLKTSMACLQEDNIRLEQIINCMENKIHSQTVVIGNLERELEEVKKEKSQMTKKTELFNKIESIINGTSEEMRKECQEATIGMYNIESPFKDCSLIPSQFMEEYF